MSQQRITKHLTSGSTTHGRRRRWPPAVVARVPELLLARPLLRTGMSPRPRQLLVCDWRAPRRTPRDDTTLHRAPRHCKASRRITRRNALQVTMPFSLRPVELQSAHGPSEHWNCIAAVFHSCALTLESTATHGQCSCPRHSPCVPQRCLRGQLCGGSGAARCNGQAPWALRIKTGTVSTRVTILRALLPSSCSPTTVQWTRWGFSPGPPAC